jgi:hypothetical protein
MPSESPGLHARLARLTPYMFSISLDGALAEWRNLPGRPVATYKGASRVSHSSTHQCRPSLRLPPSSSPAVACAPTRLLAAAPIALVSPISCSDGSNQEGESVFIEILTHRDLFEHRNLGCVQQLKEGCLQGDP